MPMQHRFRPLTLATLTAAVLAAGTLAACDRSDDQRTAGQKVDSAIATTKQKLETARDDTAKATSEARSDMKDTAQDAKNSVNDATITASVNAKLAGDKELSALRINVDTVDGRVALRGTAPNPSARERATQLASQVDGVRAVENQLVVSSKS